MPGRCKAPIHRLERWLSPSVTLAVGLTLAASAEGARGADYFVTSTAAIGAGSLAQAILEANNNPGLDTIRFNLSGTAPFVITPASALPAITDPVDIDGRSQSGYVNHPVVELNGANAGANSSGLRIIVANCAVRGLAINRFGAQGIQVEGAGTNVFQGNFIGTDTLGSSNRRNTGTGIYLSSSWANLIGGTNANEGNVISGNGDGTGDGKLAGLYIQGGGGNIVQGNVVGLRFGATAALGNDGSGISILNSQANIIGGTTASARNIVSGNAKVGIFVDGTPSISNVIQGNFIGTDITGSLVVSNGSEGVWIRGTSHNLVGGTAPGAGNVISANGKSGVYFENAWSNSIQGNLIGTAGNGQSGLGNRLPGVMVLGGYGNTIGGTSAAARNVISANRQAGVEITNSAWNTVSGNFIGVDVTGTNALGNLLDGVRLSASSSNMIGAATSGGRNIISGNGFHGVELSTNSGWNQVLGNHIGTDASGNRALGNTNTGVRVDAAGFNLVGSPGAGNVISGNAMQGVYLVNGALSNSVLANYIGLNAAGTAALTNRDAGVGISGSAGNNIGAPGAGNVISGNAQAGLFLQGAGAAYNVVSGNRIGTDASGTASVMNLVEGMFVNGARSNTIGGITTEAGNLISGNAKWGISLTNAHWNSFKGNVIGTAVDEVTPLPNGRVAGSTGNGFQLIELNGGSSGNTFGGSTTQEGNVIAYSMATNGVNYAGIRVRDGCTNNLIGANRMFSNAGLAIDIGAYTVTENDAGDPDWGGNGLQNFPVLNQVVTGTGIGVRGTLNSRPNQVYRLQFFANAACDPVYGNGEGQIFLGETSVATAADSNAVFTVSLPGTLAPGQVVTATATDSYGNTSEFSDCRGVEPAPLLKFSVVTTPSPALQLSWTNSPSGFVLKQTDNLQAPIVWVTVPGVPPAAGGNFVFSAPMTATNRFYLLQFE